MSKADEVVVPRDRLQEIIQVRAGLTGLSSPEERMDKMCEIVGELLAVTPARVTEAAQEPVAWIAEVAFEHFDKDQLSTVSHKKHGQFADKTYWLIERGQLVNHQPTVWYKGDIERSTYKNDWTESAVEARRFKTASDAQFFADAVFGLANSTYQITEHMDVDMQRPAAAPELAEPNGLLEYLRSAKINGVAGGWLLMAANYIEKLRAAFDARGREIGQREALHGACAQQLKDAIADLESAERRVAALDGALNGLLINCPNCGGMGQVETGAIQRGVPFWRDCGYCASARITHIRQVLKISVTELSRIFGVSRQAVHEWLKGGALSPRNAQRLSEFAQAADVFLESGIDVTPGALRRKISGGQSLLESVGQGGNAIELARALVGTLSRELQQRQRLASRLAGRPKPAMVASDFGTPHLHEDT